MDKVIQWVKDNFVIVAIIVIVLLVIIYKRQKKGIPALSLRSSTPNAEEKEIVSKFEALNNLTARKKAGDELLKQEEHLLKFYREANDEEKKIFSEFLDGMTSIFKASASKPQADFQKFFTAEVTKFENAMYTKYGKDKMKAYRDKMDKYAVDL